MLDAIQPSAHLVAGSSEDTTPSSGLGVAVEFDFASAEMDPLGGMFDMPTDFDWVCCPFTL
jgi:hypothetical protein